MLLMVLPTCEDADSKESRSALLARDEAELEDLRKELRRLRREKRAVMVWKRGDCILVMMLGLSMVRRMSRERGGMRFAMIGNSSAMVDQVWCRVKSEAQPLVFPFCISTSLEADCVGSE